MADYSFIIAIAGVLLIGAMSPGPSFLVVAQNALAKSRAHGVATAVGTALGVSVFAVLASLGVTTLIEKVPSAYLVFKIAGGMYLVYLAIRLWRGAKAPLPTSTEIDSNRGSMTQSFFIGLITQLSNPKTALVIAGVFAAFVPAEPPSNTTLIVSSIAFVIDFFWYAVVAFTLSNRRSQGVYRRAKHHFDRLASVLLGTVGARLIVS